MPPCRPQPGVPRAPVALAESCRGPAQTPGGEAGHGLGSPKPPGSGGSLQAATPARDKSSAQEDFIGTAKRDGELGPWGDTQWGFRAAAEQRRCCGWQTEQLPLADEAPCTPPCSEHHHGATTGMSLLVTSSSSSWACCWACPYRGTPWETQTSGGWRGAQGQGEMLQDRGWSRPPAGRWRGTAPAGRRGASASLGFGGPARGWARPGGCSTAAELSPRRRRGHPGNGTWTARPGTGLPGACWTCSEPAASRRRPAGARRPAACVTWPRSRNLPAGRPGKSWGEAWCPHGSHEVMPSLPPLLHPSARGTCPLPGRDTSPQEAEAGG